MNAVLGGLRREPSAAVIIGALCLLTAAVATAAGVSTIAVLVLLTIIFAAAHRRLLQWHSLVGLVLVVVLFIPIKRYKLPGSLPFNFELYRLVVALVVLAWLTSLLIDPRVRLRRTAFDAPLLLIGAWILASELANPGRVNSLSDYVAKGLTFFLSFVLVYYVITSVIGAHKHVVVLVKVIVLGVSAIALSGIVEQRTGYNVFFHLHSVLPFLQFEGISQVVRFGRLRVYASAQHPIALGAALVMPIPLAIYLLRTEGRRWAIPLAILFVGALATGSRTAIVMLIAMAIVFLRLKPRETRRLWPALLPLLAVIHVILPGAIGGIKEAFFPSGGIIAEQSSLVRGADPNLAGGRIRQLRPMLGEAAGHPLFGEGYGTRITGFSSTFRNAPILDNQWLDNVLELGYAGLVLWIWLFVRSVRRLMKASRSAAREGDDWLFAGLAASLAGFGIGMFTFDAFSFIQVTFLFWIFLALSAALLAIDRRAPYVAGRPRP